MIKKKYFYDLNNFLKKDLKEPKNKNQYIFLSKFEKKKYNKLLKIYQ